MRAPPASRLLEVAHRLNDRLTARPARRVRVSALSFEPLRHPTTSRPATADDVPLATTIITQAFADDPVWGPALRRSDGAAVDLTPYWGLFVEGGIRFGTARMTDDGAAVAIWIPPGENELSDDGLAELSAFVERSFDEAARHALETLYERFEGSRAGRADHYYLSLLATHPAHRGQGRGQQLLAEDLG